MTKTNLINSISKINAIFLLVLIFSSCTKNNKEVISFYENGNPKLVYFTKMDKNIKYKVAEKMYYENGKLQYEGNFNNNEKTGKWTYYFENGAIFSKCDFTNSKSGNGWEVYKMDNTKIVSSKDKIDEVSFYPEGTLAAIKFRNQNQEKEYKFFPSFKVMEERNYKGNILNGQTLSFYENGNINSKNYFKDGMQDSIYVLYYENGTTQIKGNYKLDTKVGKWEYFREDGSPDGEEIYGDEGSLLKPRDTGLKYYDKEGNEIKF
ncbi:MAG: hypothetical protein RBT05_02760 [Bacteroidales bacterium]|jgi:antitoxin component YwqK of YwqJK toxin-antitoxin module|nr:hypothetical protein [Bacteroidales bacterium]